MLQRLHWRFPTQTGIQEGESHTHRPPVGVPSLLHERSCGNTPMTHKRSLAVCLATTLMLCGALLGSLVRQPRAKGTARINGAAFYYEIFGRGPTLVFLNAGLADSRVWDREVEYFSGKYSVLRLDTRGYGKSDAPVEPYVPVDDLHGRLRFLGIERACVIGLSMGGNPRY
jgi:hypothetical protein